MVPTDLTFFKSYRETDLTTFGRCVVAIAAILSSHLLLLVKLPSSGVQAPTIHTIKKAPARGAFLMVPTERLELPTH